jgi:hypothetical protein
LEATVVERIAKGFRQLVVFTVFVFLAFWGAADGVVIGSRILRFVAEQVSVRLHEVQQELNTWRTVLPPRR